ncbi:Ku protein [Nocardiopsis sp. B62]|uniref:non-homologous end joining protein Ku n=1 Tax=Nocardiopsis sp. B62 TaxID=2824874 RepID=UPI001B35F27E|nr:Ku protein [Nocardiopsis sp. B62]MBQ1081010.1 Ku protein [Nocardiopsis sp. B62]
MPGTVWTGTISFGLVSVGVRMYSARERHGPTVHQFVRGTNARVRYQRVNEDTGERVANEDIVKGAEVDDSDSFVLLEPADMEQIQPGRSRTLEIEGFISAEDVDPLWFSSTYYLGPDKSSAKPYQLLLAALEESGRAGLGTLVMRNRQHLALIAPQQGVLTASTLYWPDEIRDPEDVMRPPSGEVDKGELRLASQLIDAMNTEWEPSQYSDEYERRLEELIATKARGGTVSYEGREPEEKGEGKVVALDDALRASLKQRKKDRAAKSGRGGRAPAPRSSEDHQPTKSELLEQARQLDIPGRSRMSKDELADAISKAS